jgi:hypothetical protein
MLCCAAAAMLRSCAAALLRCCAAALLRKSSFTVIYHSPALLPGEGNAPQQKEVEVEEQPFHPLGKAKK